LDPTHMFNSNQSLPVEDRDALMQLPIRELRERATARRISLQGVIEKRDIVELLLNSSTRRPSAL